MRLTIVHNLAFTGESLNYVPEEYKSLKPIILLYHNSTSIRDQIYTHMIDLQVYHPKTNYINGRPDWMLKGKKSIALPDDINSFEGYHLRATPIDEDPSIAIPVDQFKIDGDKYLVLPIGKYAIEILDCNRLLHSRYLLNVE
ncbi:MAG: hypothetical protein ACI9FN_001067 [Saprospiraceae bacterium]|jgi:hypothetical protein